MSRFLPGVTRVLPLTAYMLLVPGRYDASIHFRGDAHHRELVLIALEGKPVAPLERILAVDGVSLVGSHDPSSDAAAAVLASGDRTIVGVVPLLTHPGFHAS